MCYVLVYYFVEGDEVPNVRIVSSFDPVYAECFPSLHVMASDVVNEVANYEGHNSFHDATPEDCSSPLVDV